MKILAFREYLWRTAQRMKRGDQSLSDTTYDQVISLTKLKVTPQTVIFDNDVATYAQRVQGHDQHTVTQALNEAAGPHPPGAFQGLSLNGKLDTQTAGPADDGHTVETSEIRARRLSGLKKQTSGSLSSSPTSGIGLLGKEGERNAHHRTSATALISGTELRNKVHAAVATDDVTAAGRLNTPTAASRRTSPTPHPAQQRRHLERLASNRAVHNYAGNDPTVLKLLDAVYVDNFSVDAAEFGPLIQPAKRGPIPSNSNQPTPGSWRPQGQLVAVMAEHTAKITRVLVSPDHTFFLTASDDGSVKVWDAARLERNVTHRSRQTYTLPPGTKVTSLCFIESTHTFVCTGSDGAVHIVKVDVSESGNATRYGKLRVLREWQIPTTGAGNEHAVWCEHYRGESSSMLILAINSGRILAVDLRFMSIVLDFQNPAQHGSPTCFCIGRRHDWLLVGTTHGVLDLWDLRFCVRLRSWTFNNAAPITRLQLHPSRKTARRNRVCVSGGTARGEVTVWDIEKVICHEVYRPAHASNHQERLHLRNYELRNLDEESAEAPLSRVAGSIATDTITSGGPSASAPALTTSMYFGLRQTSDDPETLHAFALTGGPDGKVRFWDSDRLDGCRLVSGGAAADGKPSYTFSQLGLDTRVLSEKMPDPSDAQSSSPSEPSRVSSSAKRRTTGSVPTGNKPSRYEVIRLSAQRLLDGHLDAITDVALLEQPFGMVLSADRMGQVFVHQ